MIPPNITYKVQLKKIMIMIQNGRLQKIDSNELKLVNFGINLNYFFSN